MVLAPTQPSANAGRGVPTGAGIGWVGRTAPSRTVPAHVEGGPGDGCTLREGGGDERGQVDPEVRANARPPGRRPTTWTPMGRGGLRRLRRAEGMT